MAIEYDLPGIGKVVLTKRRASRHVRLRVGHDGIPQASLPVWLPYRDALKFVVSKGDWIAKQRAGRKSHIPIHGQRIGKTHRLTFMPGNTDKVRTRLIGNEAVVYFPDWLSPADKQVHDAVEKLFVKVLKQQSEALLPQRLAQLANQLGFTYSSVKISKMRSRWGSCSSEKLITLNCYLIQLPWELIDYVLVHELVHTEVLSHGDDFWALFTKVLPDAKNRRKEIKKYRPHILSEEA